MDAYLEVNRESTQDQRLCYVGWLGKKEGLLNYGPTPSVKKDLFLRPINQAGGWGIKD